MLLDDGPLERVLLNTILRCSDYGFRRPNNHNDIVFGEQYFCEDFCYYIYVSSILRQKTLYVRTIYNAFRKKTHFQLHVIKTSKY